MSRSPEQSTTTDSSTAILICLGELASSGVPPKRKRSPTSTSTAPSRSSKPESESQIQSKILAMLKKRNIWYAKIHQTGFSRNGIPDILICHQGKFLAMEIKTPERAKTQTPLQKMEQLSIRRSGGVCEVVTSVQQAAELLLLLEGGTRAAAAGGGPQ